MQCDACHSAQCVPSPARLRSRHWRLPPGRRRPFRGQTTACIRIFSPDVSVERPPPVSMHIRHSVDAAKTNGWTPRQRLTLVTRLFEQLCNGCGSAIAPAAQDIVLEASLGTVGFLSVSRCDSEPSAARHDDCICAGGAIVSWLEPSGILRRMAPSQSPLCAGWCPDRQCAMAQQRNAEVPTLMPRRPSPVEPWLLMLTCTCLGCIGTTGPGHSAQREPLTGLQPDAQLHADQRRGGRRRGRAGR